MGERHLYALVNYKREKHTCVGLGVRRTDRETEKAQPAADRRAARVGGWPVL